jgi:hypothetical protein
MGWTTRNTKVAEIRVARFLRAFIFLNLISATFQNLEG